jgi:hypothetical protein
MASETCKRRTGRLLEIAGLCAMIAAQLAGAPAWAAVHHLRELPRSVLADSAGHEICADGHGLPAIAFDSSGDAWQALESALAVHRIAEVAPDKAWVESAAQVETPRRLRYPRCARPSRRES